MLQRGSNALRRAVQNTRASISTRAPGTLLIQGMTPSRNYSLNTVSTVRKTHGLGSTQLFSAVQHDVVTVRGPQKRIVSNLDPNHLKMSDIVDLNGPVRPSVRFGGSVTLLNYHHTNTHIPFPPNSRGFFYYHSRPGLPAGAGDIRFRVVDSQSAPDSAGDLFANGRDMLDHTGHRPWHIHMLQLYTTRNYDPIRQFLLSQGLIDAAQDREIEQRVSVSNLKSGGWPILDTISDTFVIQLPMAVLRLAFIHGECIVPASSVGYRLHWRDARRRVYQGAAVARLELKKAETNKMFYGVKEGEVVLVLRILKLLDPVSLDGVPFRLPEGNDLIQGRSPNWSWCTSLDRAQRLGIITPTSLKKLEELYLDKNASIEATATKGPPL
ncbi:hypothetical protein D9611_001990 [Ephemerocybe angulata]|uniref:Uncharacterized protein n=1 Tax=Ephemerocybe angulata TaxID=980116 RepID=A0A8H5CHQ3_9AGAR|nr:hypothetical protein D9611_001990 [Tulosesus angulatus]